METKGPLRSRKTTTKSRILSLSFLLRELDSLVLKIATNQEKKSRLSVADSK